MDFRTISTEVLVIGGGVAGLRAAVAAAELGTEVAIVSKPSCASPEIMGFNAPVMPGDSKELYFSDIEQSGYGINDSRLAMVLSEHVLDEVTYLEGLGLEFDRDAEGRYLPIHTLGTAYPRLIKTGVSSGSANRPSPSAQPRAAKLSRPPRVSVRSSAAPGSAQPRTSIRAHC